MIFEYKRNLRAFRDLTLTLRVSQSEKDLILELVAQANKDKLWGKFSQSDIIMIALRRLKDEINLETKTLKNGKES